MSSINQEYARRIKQEKIEQRKKEEAAKSGEEIIMVRARDEKGHFIPDNPDTPEIDEAWVEKKVSKTKKKKTTKKKK
tara:strand:+ start:98 stop:328 length:231 start_codon:yes stop_codon:yes gene_type:complete